jgi:hypothetical protein
MLIKRLVQLHRVVKRDGLRDPDPRWLKEHTFPLVDPVEGNRSIRQSERLVS